MGWFGVFPRTGRNDLFVAPVNRDTNKNVCPHIATKTWPRYLRFCSVKYVDFFFVNFLRAFIVKLLNQNKSNDKIKYETDQQINICVYSVGS